MKDHKKTSEVTIPTGRKRAPNVWKWLLRGVRFFIISIVRVSLKVDQHTRCLMHCQVYRGACRIVSAGARDCDGIGTRRRAAYAQLKAGSSCDGNVGFSSIPQD